MITSSISSGTNFELHSRGVLGLRLVEMGMDCVLNKKWDLSLFSKYSLFPSSP